MPDTFWYRGELFVLPKVDTPKDNITIVINTDITIPTPPMNLLIFCNVFPCSGNDEFSIKKQKHAMIAAMPAGNTTSIKTCIAAGLQTMTSLLYLKSLT